ncbi:TIGR02281 family clan AA aspartic protease [Myxosarcina sp. GI1]|uniref:retropepsin-like aspartic protease family protein n=1 Tax=Myxosarcina sp. GI1 TaxID=1541065 RepID=UPI000564B3AA|nr:retropepsin-like aspartic protease [Myxosarcina sp. GI1]
MKNLFKLLLLSLIFNCSSTTANAQESACFMQDASGKPLDLSHLCRNGKSPNRRQTNSATVYEPRVYTIPIIRRNAGIPVIEVQFNERYVFEMMLDTGASMTVLTPQMARALNFEPLGSLPVQTPSHELVYLPLGQVKSIAAAGSVARNVPVVVSSSLTVGLLGQNFFGNFDVTIKYDVIEFRER